MLCSVSVKLPLYLSCWCWAQLNHHGNWLYALECSIVFSFANGLHYWCLKFHNWLFNMQIVLPHFLLESRVIMKVVYDQQIKTICLLDELCYWLSSWFADDSDAHLLSYKQDISSECITAHCHCMWVECDRCVPRRTEG